MSFAVVKGVATQAQLYLDTILGELVAETGREEDRYSIGKLIFKCLRDRPEIVNAIEGGSGKNIRNGEILEQSIKTANAMKSASVNVGDTVMIIGTNHLLLAVPYYASTFIGAVSIHIDAGVTVSELVHLVKICKPKLIFANANKVITVEDALRESEAKAGIISFGEKSGAGCLSIYDILKEYDGSLETFSAVDVNKDSPAVIICTSGSTGLPKAAVITNYGSVAKLLDFSIKDIKLPVKDATFLLLASCQWVGYIMAMNFCIVSGHTKIYTSQALNPLHILELLRKYKPDNTIFGPAIATAVIDSPDFGNVDLKCIKTLYMGGSVVHSELQERLKKIINPDGQVLVAGGCTEVCGLYTIQDRESVSGSMGKEYNTLQYKIVDKTGQEVPVGETGELILKSKEIICKGYYNDEIATKELFTPDGWLKTGDIVYKDDKGEYFFVDRLKLIIKGGVYRVFPAEVELVIQNVGDIKQVGVCGSERGVTAIVVPRPGCDTTTLVQRIHDAVNSKLSHYKQLKGGVFLVDALPETKSGKIDRKALQLYVTKVNC